MMLFILFSIVNITLCMHIECTHVPFLFHWWQMANLPDTGRTPTDHRPVIVRPLFIFCGPSGHRRMIGRLSVDHRTISSDVSQRLKNFCKHISSGCRPMIDRAPVADQAFLRRPSDFSDILEILRCSDILRRPEEMWLRYDLLLLHLHRPGLLKTFCHIF